MTFSMKDGDFGRRFQFSGPKVGRGVQKLYKKKSPLGDRVALALAMNIPLRDESNKVLVSGVLVKFFFKDETLIPKGIRRVERDIDTVMDKLHAGLVEYPDLAARNRHRMGRVDTGEPVVDGLPHVQPGIIRRALANNGFHLVDAHYFKHPRTGQFVVVLEFLPVKDTVGVEKLKLSRQTLEAVRFLAGSVWDQCYVWDNPGDAPVTVNYSGYCHNQQVPPKFLLTVTDKCLELFEAVGVQDEATEAATTKGEGFASYHPAE